MARAASSLAEQGSGLRKGDGHLANRARLGGADGGACAFAQLVRSKIGRLAEADEEKALGVEAGGGVQQ